MLAALPFDSGLPAFTRQFSNQAAQHRIDLTSISIGSISQATAAATTPTTTAPSSAASGSTPSAGTGATAGAVFAIPVTIVSTGSAVDQLAFLKAIQVDGPRRALVISTALTPASGATTASIDASSTMTTQLSVFTAPLSSTAQAQLEKLLSGNITD